MSPTTYADPRERFDAALIPGMRDRLAAGYARFRTLERAAVASMSPLSVDNYRDRDCPMCSAPNSQAKLALQAHGLDLIECQECSLTYTRQILDEVADAERYRESDLDAAAMALRESEPYLELETARADYYLSLLDAEAGRVGALLEVGCGTGTLLVQAKRRGWRALGLEPGLSASAVARRRGVTVVNGWFPQDLPEEPRLFDTIAILDVLEHFASPRQLLRSLRERLAPEGRLLIQVPNWDSLLVRLEGAASSTVCTGHWTYFTPSTLERCLRSEGFRADALETVVSELDRIERFPRDQVEACLLRLRPESRPGPLDAKFLHALGLSYKIVGVFGSDSRAPSGA